MDVVEPPDGHGDWTGVLALPAAVMTSAEAPLTVALTTLCAEAAAFADVATDGDAGDGAEGDVPPQLAASRARLTRPTLGNRNAFVGI
ncbi:MAG: hypothetical protein U0163_00215 [Gemmatimonadaceae bacterium]